MKNMKIKEEDIARVMASLHCGRDEAIDVLECDMEIDHGARMDYDLDKEKEKQALREAHKGQGRTGYNFTKRERKPDEAKRAIMAMLMQYLNQSGEGAGLEDIVLAKEEGEITFTLGTDEYSLKLIKHRAK